MQPIALIEKLEVKERKISRKQKDPVKENWEHRRRYNMNCTHVWRRHGRHVDKLGKGRLLSVGMHKDQLDLRLLLSKKTARAWFTEVEGISRK